MTDFSLQDLLFGDTHDSLPDMVLHTDKSHQDLLKAQENLRKKLKGLNQIDLHAETARHMENLLDIPLDLVLVRGWLKLREVRQHIAKQQETGSDETVVMYLSEHSINSTHSPVLEVKMGNECIFRLQLDIALSLKLSAVGLVIKQARIEEVTSGTCKGKGSIAYLKEKLLEKDIAKINLLGKIHIPDERLIEKGDDEAEQVLAEGHS